MSKFRPGERVVVLEGKFRDEKGTVTVDHAEGCKVLLDGGYEREYEDQYLCLLNSYTVRERDDDSGIDVTAAGLTAVTLDLPDFTFTDSPPDIPADPGFSGGGGESAGGGASDSWSDSSPSDSSGSDSGSDW